jgi:preprotein translocase subunit Sec61beta
MNEDPATFIDPDTLSTVGQAVNILLIVAIVTLIVITAHIIRK